MCQCVLTWHCDQLAAFEQYVEAALWITQPTTGLQMSHVLTNYWAYTIDPLCYVYVMLSTAPFYILHSFLNEHFVTILQQKCWVLVRRCVLPNPPSVAVLTFTPPKNQIHNTYILRTILVPHSSVIKNMWYACFYSNNKEVKMFIR